MNRQCAGLLVPECAGPRVGCPPTTASVGAESTVIKTVLHSLPERHCFRRSVWRSTGSEAGPPIVRTCRKLMLRHWRSWLRVCLNGRVYRRSQDVAGSEKWSIRFGPASSSQIIPVIHLAQSARPRRLISLTDESARATRSECQRLQPQANPASAKSCLSQVKENLSKNSPTDDYLEIQWDIYFLRLNTLRTC